MKNLIDVIQLSHEREMKQAVGKSVNFIVYYYIDNLEENAF